MSIGNRKHWNTLMHVALHTHLTTHDSDVFGLGCCLGTGSFKGSPGILKRNQSWELAPTSVVLRLAHRQDRSVEQLQGEPSQGHKLPSLAPADPSVGSGESLWPHWSAHNGKGTAGCLSDSYKTRVHEDQARYLKAGISKLLKSWHTWKRDYLYCTS